MNLANEGNRRLRDQTRDHVAEPQRCCPCVALLNLSTEFIPDLWVFVGQRIFCIVNKRFPVKNSYATDRYFYRGLRVKAQCPAAVGYSANCSEGDWLCFFARC